MNKKKIVVVIFVLVALVQLYIPAKMILDRENVLDTGNEFKFITAPIDPTDPFRGKYINLSYEDNLIEVQNEKDWVHNETIYVLLEIDSNGFAKNKSISKTKPAGSPDFIKAEVRSVTSNGTNMLTIHYPFDRFYMEESKAYDAELAYSQSLKDTSKVTYAIVSIKNGDAVLKDVVIEGISISEIVKASQENKNSEK
ncbi:GDYXXLXY domain-containing protein [Bacteroidota bacterium]